MVATLKESVTRKVFPKGQIVIPVALRKKYHIDIGDHLDVIPKADGILLKPMPKKEGKKSLTDCLFGIFGKYLHGAEQLLRHENGTGKTQTGEVEFRIKSIAGTDQKSGIQEEECPKHRGPSTSHEKPVSHKAQDKAQRNVSRGGRVVCYALSGIFY
jgi:AbrB family looped-hinge helix DNA binding protein